MPTQQQTERKDQAPLPGPRVNPQPAPRLPLPELPKIPFLGAGGGSGGSLTDLFGGFGDGLTAGGRFFPFSDNKPQVGPTREAAAKLNGGAPEHHTPTLAEYGSKFDAEINTQILGNRTTRAALDKAEKEKSPTAGATETKLDGDREALLERLTERSGVYNESIEAINAKLPEKLGKTLTPEQKALVDQRTKLEKDRDKFSDQQTALQRWSDRNEINDINEQLKNPNLDAKAKAELLADKKELATGLLSTTKSFQQFDPRWGSTIYGKDRSYSNMTEAGCGPTALAMMLDFWDQEDPEGQHSRGVKEPYTPRTAADYATNHGRVKGSGTSGDVMINDVGVGFPGFEGHKIANRAGAAEQLHNGIPVMFLGHDITGKGADGKNVRPYGGHFMLLNGVSDDNKTFDVHDGGRNNSKNIHSISDQQLNKADGYWTLSK